MTVSKLIKNKRFRDFCFFEYGISSEELIQYSVNDLFELMKKWFYSPRALFAPLGSLRSEVEKAISDKLLKL